MKKKVSYHPDTKDTIIPDKCVICGHRFIRKKGTLREFIFCLDCEKKVCLVSCSCRSYCMECYLNLS